MLIQLHCIILNTTMVIEKPESLHIVEMPPDVKI